MRRAIVTLSVAPVFGILEREEDVRPGLVAAELGDLALDPDRRQPAEVHRDAAVERGDGEDLAVAVDDGLDLGHAARLRASVRGRLADGAEGQSANLARSQVHRGDV